MSGLSELTMFVQLQQAGHLGRLWVSALQGLGLNQDN